MNKLKPYIGRHETLTHYFTLNPKKENGKTTVNVFVYTYGVIGFPPAGSGEIVGVEEAIEKVMAVRDTGYRKVDHNFVADTEEDSKSVVNLHDWLRGV